MILHDRVNEGSGLTTGNLEQQRCRPLHCSGLALPIDSAFKSMRGVRTHAIRSSPPGNESRSKKGTFQEYILTGFCHGSGQAAHHSVRYVMQRVDLDEPLLREIAERTNGRYFRATDAEALADVFDTIDELEQTEIESRVRVLHTELFHYVLLPALVLLGLERVLLGTRLKRIP